MKKTLLALAMIASVCAAPANAAIEDTVTVEISYDLAELESDAGAVSTYRALRAQARRACKYVPIASPIRRIDFDCMREVMDEAVAAIRSPKLTALHTPSEIRRTVLARR